MVAPSLGPDHPVLVLVRDARLQSAFDAGEHRSLDAVDRPDLGCELHAPERGAALDPQSPPPVPTPRSTASELELASLNLVTVLLSVDP